MSGAAHGFSWDEQGSDVVISHQGRVATVLRGVTAEQFRADVQHGEPQQLMARLTGNYKRGNERQARQHPRNR